MHKIEGAQRVHGTASQEELDAIFGLSGAMRYELEEVLPDGSVWCEETQTLIRPMSKASDSTSRPTKVYYPYPDYVDDED